MNDPLDNSLVPPAPGDSPSPGQAAPVSSANTHSTEPPAPAPQFDPSVPEDLRTPWDWPDVILFVVFVLGSSIVFPAIVAIAAIVGWGIKPEQLTQPTSAQAAVLTIGQVLWSAGSITYLYVTVRLRRRVPFWNTIGWRPIHTPSSSRKVTATGCFFGGMGMAILVGIITEHLHTKGKLPIEQLFQTRKSILLLMFFGTLVAPLVEETIFRGYLYPVLARRLGVPAGVVLTGMLFGLMHAQQLWGGWGQIGLITLVGIVLTVVRARTGTVLASYLVHLGYNGFIFFALVVGTHGLRDFPGH